MSSIICFDIDGMIVKREVYFSERLAKQQHIPAETILPFFKRGFQQCLIGKADLKMQLSKNLAAWKWTGTVDELMDFWFSNERELNEPILALVQKLRAAGVQCWLTTNNEQYRVAYLMDQVGLREKFDGIAASYEMGVRKSEPTFWKLALTRMAHPDASQVQVWDDDEKNVAAAAAAGLTARLYTGFEEFEKAVKNLI